MERERGKAEDDQAAGLILAQGAAFTILFAVLCDEAVLVAERRGIHLLLDVLDSTCVNLILIMDPSLLMRTKCRGCGNFPLTKAASYPSSKAHTHPNTKHK